MPIQAGTYRNTDGVFVFLSLSVAHSNCHTSSLSPNTFVDCCFLSSLSLVVARRRSLLLVVARRRSLSLLVARLSLSTRHLTVSLMRAHTLSLLSLSLSLVDCQIVPHGIFVYHPPSPSLHLVALRLTLFSIPEYY